MQQITSNLTPAGDVALGCGPSPCIAVTVAGIIVFLVLAIAVRGLAA
jgi:hypothetical protein